MRKGWRRIGSGPRSPLHRELGGSTYCEPSEHAYRRGPWRCYQSNGITSLITNVRHVDSLQDAYVLFEGWGAPSGSQQELQVELGHAGVLWGQRPGHQLASLFGSMPTRQLSGGLIAIRGPYTPALIDLGAHFPSLRVAWCGSSVAVHRRLRPSGSAARLLLLHRAGRT